MMFFSMWKKDKTNISQVNYFKFHYQYLVCYGLSLSAFILNCCGIYLNITALSSLSMLCIVFAIIWLNTFNYIFKSELKQYLHIDTKNETFYIGCNLGWFYSFLTLTLMCLLVSSSTLFFSVISCSIFFNFFSLIFMSLCLLS